MKKISRVKNNSTLFNSVSFRANFKFHGNLDISKCPLKIFPSFYKEMDWIGNEMEETGWIKHFSSPISFPSTVTSQFLWFNKNIENDGKCVCFEEFSINGANFPRILFKNSENMKL